MPPILAMAATAALLVIYNTGCTAPTADQMIERHITGPAELPEDPGDVPPEAELFARGR